MGNALCVYEGKIPVKSAEYNQQAKLRMLIKYLNDENSPQKPKRQEEEPKVFDRRFQERLSTIGEEGNEPERERKTQLFLEDFLADIDAKDTNYFGAPGEGIFTSRDSPKYGFGRNRQLTIDTTEDTDPSFDRVYKSFDD